MSRHCELRKCFFSDRSRPSLLSSSTSTTTRKKIPSPFVSLFHHPQTTKNSASAESELKARQASARAWVTPWLEARKKGGSGSGAATETKKPNRPAAASAADAAAAPSEPAAKHAGKKVKGGEVLADGSVMYRF